MDMVQKQIDLAAHVCEPVEAIRVEILESNANGAILWSVEILRLGETRYVIEGETGEMLEPIEGECQAYDAWRS